MEVGQETRNMVVTMGSKRYFDNGANQKEKLNNQECEQYTETETGQVTTRKDIYSSLRNCSPENTDQNSILFVSHGNFHQPRISFLGMTWSVLLVQQLLRGVCI